MPSESPNCANGLLRSLRETSPTKSAPRPGLVRDRLCTEIQTGQFGDEKIIVTADNYRDQFDGSTASSNLAEEEGEKQSLNKTRTAADFENFLANYEAFLQTEVQAKAGYYIADGSCGSVYMKQLGLASTWCFRRELVEGYRFCSVSTFLRPRHNYLKCKKLGKISKKVE